MYIHFKSSGRIRRLRLFCCLIVFLFTKFTIHSTNVVAIEKAQDWKKVLISELMVLQDAGNQYSASDLITDSNKQFLPNRNERPSAKLYWARIQITNQSDQDENIFFETSYWDYLQLYFIINDRITDTLNIGIQDKGYKANYGFKKGDSVMILARFKSSGHFRLEPNINLILTKSVERLSYFSFSHYMDGIILGILIGLCIYNLFLAISLQDLGYYLYTAYLIVIGLGFFSFFQFHPSHLASDFIRSYPSVAFYIKKVVDNLNSAMLILFVRQFLGTRSKYPIWDKILLLMVLFQVSQYVFNYFDIIRQSNASRIYLGSFLRYNCLIIALYDYLKGNKKVIVFIIGLFIVLIGDTNAILSYKGIDLFWFLPHVLLVDYFRGPVTFFACGALEAIVFSFALAGKYNHLQEDVAKVTLEKEQEKQTLLAAQNETLERQVKERTQELSQTIETLKATQSQLIQSEKMASLGELTAGIAHEIQNPLNFINNFSELNLDILQEVEDNPDVNLFNNSTSMLNLKKNTEKIQHHGKRIDGIVKGMLQHSRSGNTNFEMTDMNQLCDESLKLAYHAFRAKDKSFSAQYETNLDPELPPLKVNIQEMSRVMLNIMNNAFYTVSSKSKKYKLMDINGNGTFNPKVILRTTKHQKGISILIGDNGEGISEANLKKIFQPFFTTKVTGEGTGLGLSICYDIVTKGHGGEIKVQSEVEVGTEFEIFIPFRN